MTNLKLVAEERRAMRALKKRKWLQAYTFVYLPSAPVEWTKKFNANIVIERIPQC